MPALPVGETVAFKVSKPLLRLIDQASNGNFANRSDYVRGAVVARLKADGVIHETALPRSAGCENAATFPSKPDATERM